MRVALLTSVGVTLDSFFPELIDAWTESGSEVFAAASTRAEVANFTLLKSMSRRPNFSNARSPREIRQWLSAVDADVLVTNTATASALARIVDVGVPVIYFCHGLHWNKGTSAQDRVWQSIESVLLRNTNGAIVINSDDESWFSSRLSTSNILRLRNGVGVPLVRYPLVPLPTAVSLKLLWAGEMSERKRPLEAVRVLEELVALGIDAELTLLGEGTLREATREFARERRLADRVRLPGRRSLADNMLTHHALIHTALWEGLPRVMLEAHSMGRRTFAYDVKGVRDIPGVELFKELDAKGMAEAIAWRVHMNELKPPTPSLVGMNSSDVAREILQFLGKFVAQMKDSSHADDER